MCLSGVKVVVFITGICRHGCFFCPISSVKKKKDISFANERPIKQIQDIITEIKKMEALGASITGGEPLEKIERVIHFIKEIKNYFGEEFHIHLYTAKSKITDEQLNRLFKTGLDEIRFHLMKKSLEPIILKALKYSWKVGIEIPVFPDNKGYLQSIAEFSNRNELDFLILNELEISESNRRKMKEMGYQPLSAFSFSVRNSAGVGKEIVEWISNNLDISVHFCAANTKDGIQFRQRLIRMAKRTARPYHEVTQDGSLLLGIVEGNYNQLEILRKRLKYELEIPTELFHLNKEGIKLEIRWDLAEALTSEFQKEGLQVALIEQYPTYDRKIITKIPL
ncbi:MAG: radical SAM protein [Promethearchaeota archaeon]